MIMSIFNKQTLAWIYRSVLLAGGGLGAILLGLSCFGFPPFMTGWVLASINAGPYYVEAHDLKLDLRGGLKASDVTVYRKGVVGPPCLEARELRILFRILDRPRAGVSRVKGIQARGGVIRPNGGSVFAGWEKSQAVVGSPSSSTAGRGSLPFMDVDLILSDFDVIGVWVGQIRAELQWDGKDARLSRLSGQVGRDLQRGSVDGTVAWKRGEQVVGRLVTAFDPRALLPTCRILYPQAGSILERFSFSAGPPRIDLSFEADTGVAYSLRAKGRMQASRYAYCGAGIGFANIHAEYEYGNGTNRLKLDPFLIVVGGRNAEGKTVIDLNSGAVGFEAMSSVDLGTVLRLCGMREQAMDSWHLEEGARVMARGILNTLAPERSLIEASVEGSRIGFSRVWVNDYAFRYAAIGLTNKFTDIRGKIGNGSFSSSMIVTPDASGTNRNTLLNVEIIHVDADTVFEMLNPNPAWRAEGKLYGNAELHGAEVRAGPGSFSGKGQMTIRNSRIFKLPLFAGLMAELNRMVPQLDFSNSRIDAHFSYELKEGRVISRDIRIDDGPVSMTAKGSCGLDGSLDFLVTFQWMKKSGFLAQSIAEIFSPGEGAEFRVGGTCASPKWVHVKRR